MAIHAPFRFAPINRRVFFPSWGKLVSHDVPFADGLCGEIEIEIEALSPLLIGGPRRKATANEPGEVWPFQTADGRYAIPSSSLQGLIRSIIEIASFAKTGAFIDDQRFGVRDLHSSQTAKSIYRNQMQPQAIRAGWLIDRNGDREIVECRYERITIEELSNFSRKGSSENLRDILLTDSDAKARYEAFLNGRNCNVLTNTYKAKAPTLKGAARPTHSQGAYATEVRATLVLTGKPQKGIGDRKKSAEFLFHSPVRDDASGNNGAKSTFVISAGVWADFVALHEPEKGSGRPVNPNWDFWKCAFNKNEPIPVFFTLNSKNEVSALGMAMMFKRAMPLSTHQLLENSTVEHLNPDRDLAELIFGFTGDTGLGLKRRVSFGDAVAKNAPKPDYLGEAILLSPKPNYYPLYVRQPAHSINQHTETYAVYANQPTASGQEQKLPELAGVKIWPSRGAQSSNFRLNSVTPEQRNVATKLNALPAETRFFPSIIRIHNMRPAEVGALLWALTIGGVSDEKSYVHRIGMGKPFGLGEIRIKLICANLSRNDGENAPEIKDLVSAYETEMQHFYAGAGGGQWRESVQVKALQKAGDPAANEGVNLTYMDGFAAYADARNNGEVPPSYVTGDEIPKVGSRGATPIKKPLETDTRPVRKGDKVKNGPQIGTVIHVDDKLQTYKIKLRNGTVTSWRRELFALDDGED